MIINVHYSFQLFIHSLPKIFTYQKKDKLKSRKQTQALFSNGNAITVHPIRLIYTMEQEDGLPNVLLQAGVGAPSRYFKKAVQRNKVKRLLREGYRLEKPHFIMNLPLTKARLNLFFLYVDAQVQTHLQIQSTVKILLEKLVVTLKSNK